MCIFLLTIFVWPTVQTLHGKYEVSVTDHLENVLHLNRQFTVFHDSATSETNVENERIVKNVYEFIKESKSFLIV